MKNNFFDLSRVFKTDFLDYMYVFASFPFNFILYCIYFHWFWPSYLIRNSSEQHPHLIWSLLTKLLLSVYSGHESMQYKCDVKPSVLDLVKRSDKAIYYLQNVFHDPTKEFKADFSKREYTRIFQKRPSQDVFMKKCSEHMQQIYRRSPMPKCDLNVVA